VLEIDRPCVFEHLLPLLRSVRIAGDVSAAVEVRQFTVADDLERLESHEAIAAAERLGGASHELPLWSGALAGEPNRERRGDRHCQ
jgi:hypothetical protein